MTFIPLFVALAMYPSVPKLWQEGPLTNETFVIPDRPIFADVAVLRAQKKLFMELEDPRLRSRLASDLRKVNNRDAFPMVMALLKREKDSFVQDDLLQTLVSLQEQGYGVPGGDDVLPGYFKHESMQARAMAMVLYLTNAKRPDVQRVVKALEKESSAMVLNRVGAVLETRAKQIQRESLLALYRSADKGNDPLKAFAIKLLAIQEDPDGNDILKQAATHQNPMIRMQLAAGLTQCPRTSNVLLDKLARDQHAGVRLTVARMKHPDASQDPILQRLLADSSSSVRASAAVSLGHGRRVDSAKALVSALGDEDYLVRWAISEGLVLAAPPRDVRQQLIQKGERDAKTRRQVIACFTKLKDPACGDYAARWMLSSADDKLVVESVNYLAIINSTSSISSIQKLVSHKNPKVREMVAKALGQLRVPASYGDLKKLYYDRVSDVSLKAMSSMVSIMDPVFIRDFEHALGTRNVGGHNRALACYALSKLDVSNAGITGNLKTLASKACIPIPMMGPGPDDVNVILSCYMYFLTRSMAGDQEATNIYLSLRNYQLALPQEDMMKNELVEEFLKQLESFRRHEKVVQKKLNYLPPDFSSEAILSK